MPKKPGMGATGVRTAKDVLNDWKPFGNPFTPMDLAHDTSDVFEGIVSDVASIPSGLMGLLDVLNSGQTPQAIGEAAVEGMIDQYSDPIGYANEHPGFFMMDLLGGLGFADEGIKAGNRFAATNPVMSDLIEHGTDMLSQGGPIPQGATLPPIPYSEAIGNTGYRLEAGDAFDLQVLGERASPKYSATSPQKGVANFGDESGSIIVKPGRIDRSKAPQQAEAEIAVNDLNIKLGDYIRMPGVAPEPVNQMYRRPKTISMTGRPQEYHQPTPVDLTVMEDLGPYAQNVDTMDAFHRLMETNQAREDMRNISLMDLIVGNKDRGPYGDGQFSNLMEDGFGRPIGIDYGLAFDDVRGPFDEPLRANPMTSFGWDESDYFAPRHVLDDPVFRDSERSMLAQAKEILSEAATTNTMHPSITNNTRFQNLVAAIRRIDEVLEAGRFPGIGGLV